MSEKHANWMAWYAVAQEAMRMKWETSAFPGSGQRVGEFIREREPGGGQHTHLDADGKEQPCHDLYDFAALSLLLNLRDGGTNYLAKYPHPGEVPAKMSTRPNAHSTLPERPALSLAISLIQSTCKGMIQDVHQPMDMGHVGAVQPSVEGLALGTGEMDRPPDGIKAPRHTTDRDTDGQGYGFPETDSARHLEYDNVNADGDALRDKHGEERERTSEEMLATADAHEPDQDEAAAADGGAKSRRRPTEDMEVTDLDAAPADGTDEWADPIQMSGHRGLEPVGAPGAAGGWHSTDLAKIADGKKLRNKPHHHEFAKALAARIEEHPEVAAYLKAPTTPFWLLAERCGPHQGTRTGWDLHDQAGEPACFIPGANGDWTCAMWEDYTKCTVSSCQNYWPRVKFAHPRLCDTCQAGWEVYQATKEI